MQSARTILLVPNEVVEIHRVVGGVVLVGGVERRAASGNRSATNVA